MTENALRRDVMLAGLAASLPIALAGSASASTLNPAQTPTSLARVMVLSLSPPITCLTGMAFAEGACREMATHNKTNYSESIDYLFASIIYLATNPSWWARSPKSLAKELALDPERLERVFEAFPGIYRKSHNLDPEYNQHTYSLHARFAQRKDGLFGEPENTSWMGQLNKDMLGLLVDLVLKSAEQERTTRRSAITNFVSVSAAIVAALAAIAAAFVKSKTSIP